jgi:hypothetical protein
MPVLLGADNDLPKKSLGLQVYQLDEATLKKFVLAQQGGFAMNMVAQSSPAADAGLQRGDVTDSEQGAGAVEKVFHNA